MPVYNYLHPPNIIEIDEKITIPAESKGTIVTNTISGPETNSTKDPLSIAFNSSAPSQCNPSHNISYFSLSCAPRNVK